MGAILVEYREIQDHELIKPLGGFLYNLKQILECDYYIHSYYKEPLAFLNNACLESLLLHTRVIDDFFWTPRKLEYQYKKEQNKPKECQKIIKPKDDDFFAIHCMTNDEYLNLYDELDEKNYILKEKEREDINKKMMHPTYDEKDEEKIDWHKYNFRCRMFSAFKLFLSYEKPRKLIEKSERWKKESFKRVVDLLIYDPAEQRNKKS